MIGRVRRSGVAIRLRRPIAASQHTSGLNSIDPIVLNYSPNRPLTTPSAIRVMRVIRVIRVSISQKSIETVSISQKSIETVSTIKTVSISQKSIETVSISQKPIQTVSISQQPDRTRTHGSMPDPREAYQGCIEDRMHSIRTIDGHCCIPGGCRQASWELYKNSMKP